ncbi:MAG: hypothetical protein P8Y69_08205 [Gammaproteobacteria bacterium]
MSDTTDQQPSRNLAIAALVIALIGTGVAVGAFVKMNALGDHEALNASLSRHLGDNQALIRTIAESPEIAETTRNELDAALQDGAVLDELVSRTLASDGLSQLVAVKGAAAVAEFKDSPEFQQAVRAATSSDETEGDPIAELNAKLGRYERDLSALARQVKDDETAAAVNTLQGQLVTLQQDIAGLSDQVACAVAYRGNSPRTFLLKSNDSTPLPGMDLVVSLSRFRNDTIETVSVSAREGALNQVHTQVIGNVELGKPFEITQGNTHYEGTFTFAQTRLFGKAFIGFEIRMTAADGQPCAPTRPPADSGELVSAADA